MGKLDGQVAIVTGAARGLGRAYALRLAGLGAKVAVIDQDLKSYTQFAAEQRQMTAPTTADEIGKLGVDGIGIEADLIAGGNGERSPLVVGMRKTPSVPLAVRGPHAQGVKT